VRAARKTIIDSEKRSRFCQLAARESKSKELVTESEELSHC